MLDPVSLLATATAVFNGLKKAVELGREAEDVFGQLGKWASAVADLQEWMSTEADRKPPLFKKLVFKESATVEAFNAYAAQVKIRQMEAELYNWFHYGALQHLGREGYLEFVQMRRSIRERREKMVYEQMRRRKKFLKTLQDSAFLLTVVGLGAIILTHIVIFMVERWPE